MHMNQLSILFIDMKENYLGYYDSYNSIIGHFHSSIHSISFCKMLFNIGINTEIHAHVKKISCKYQEPIRLYI